MKKCFVYALAAALTISLAACGNGEENQQEQQEQQQGYVYVPEFISLNSEGEAQNIGSPQLEGENLYYTSYYWDEETGQSGYKFYRRDLTTGEETELPIDLSIEGATYSSPVSELIFDQEGNIVCLVNATIMESESDYKEEYYLFKFDADCNQLSKQDVTEGLTLTNTENSWAQRAILDSEGRLYVMISTDNNACIVVLDAEGNKLAEIDTGSDWVSGLGATGDGKVLVMRYSNTGAGMECLEVDLAGKTLGNPHGNIPSPRNSEDLTFTLDGGLLINDGSKLWRYDLETEAAEEILVWTDSNINGDYVQRMQMLEDGRIAVYSRNWSNDSQEIAYLTRKDASEVTEKKVLNLATMWSNSDLQEAVVNFNKTNDTYKIRITTYYDNASEWTETKYQDAITALNAAITSSNCPDLIDLSYGNVKSYVAKGLLMDLAPFLEKSSVKREELIESVLDAYTFDGVLVSIPISFSVNTIMGRTSQLGDRTGWTIKDIMEFSAQYPEAKLFQYASKASMLSTCLQYSSDAFIDYSNGKCSFDSQDFMDILEFCNTFPTEVDYDSEEDSFPKQIADGRILLNNMNLYDVTEMQMYSLMFNEPITFIGYPTVDGSSGNRLNGQSCYAITTKCSNPDGAWAFIESMLQYKPHPEWGGMHNLPIRKDMLEEGFEKAMEDEMALDENGDPALDENGDPIIYPKTTWGYEDWEAEIYAATPEQIQMIRDLIDSASASTNNDETILNIINEEAAAYFEGQKSAQEVASVIQSRVQTYVSENS
ncbi:MAG: extracellular solute-binding protein [bacterium]|nr:extracellular solute-binding protein [bacterium]MCM1375609.1 extracellular solute-binding protein [Muribaculum sp.]